MSRTSTRAVIAFAGFVTASLAFSPAFAQRTDAPAPTPDDALAQNFQAQHEIGRASTSIKPTFPRRRPDRW